MIKLTDTSATTKDGFIRVFENEINDNGDIDYKKAIKKADENDWQSWSDGLRNWEKKKLFNLSDLQDIEID